MSLDGRRHETLVRSPNDVTSEWQSRRAKAWIQLHRILPPKDEAFTDGSHELDQIYIRRSQALNLRLAITRDRHAWSSGTLHMVVTNWCS